MKSRNIEIQIWFNESDCGVTPATLRVGAVQWCDGCYGLLDALDGVGVGDSAGEVEAAIVRIITREQRLRAAFDHRGHTVRFEARMAL